MCIGMRQYYLVSEEPTRMVINHPLQSNPDQKKLLDK